MFDFNDSFGLHVTSLLKKISNEPTCTQGFLFIFQFSSSRNSPGGDVQIKSSSAAYSVSEWFSAAQSGHHKHRLARAPFLCQKQGGWKLCPQPARGAHAPPPTLAFPLSPASTPLPAIPTSNISLAKWHQLGDTYLPDCPKMDQF